MAFYGTVVKPGKQVPLVPHAEGYALHLSQAALPAAVKEKSRVSLQIKVGDEEPIVLCTLCAGVTDTVLLDQFISEYAELSVSGSGEVHVTGYYSPQFGEEDDDDEDEDGYGMHPMDMDDEIESDDEDEEDEEDYFMAAAGRKEPSVIIEDVTDKEPDTSRALPAPAAAAAADEGKKRKAEEAAEEAAAKKQAKQQQQQQQQQQKELQKQKEQHQKQKEQKQQEEQQQLKQQKQQQKQQKQQQDTKAEQKQKQKQQQQPGKTPEAKPAAEATAAQPLPSKKGVKKFENGFEIHSTKMGDPHGKLAKAGKQVKVKYVGRLSKTGKVFDKTTNKPLSFRLGVGEVIKGWDVGVEGMRVGDKRKLVIPPQMGYGSQKMGPIPPNSTLEFEVELVDVK